MCKKLDIRFYQSIHIGYEGTNQKRIYDRYIGQVFVTADIHTDEAYCYDKQDFKP